MRTHRDGITLVEVLVAMVILAVGMVGILAVFSQGIDSGRSSAEETRAAMAAESFKHALTAACKNAEWATVAHGGKGGHTITLVHDLDDGSGARGRIPLLLPASEAWRYPPLKACEVSKTWAGAPPANPAEPQKDAAFSVGGDFQISFDARPAGSDSLFEFCVHVMRRRELVASIPFQISVR
jgi:prepilin-type N-terminal cleavage/methylation domain-containing protein